MKRAAPWVLFFLVLAILIWSIMEYDARVAEIMATSDAQIEAASSKVREIRGQLQESQRRYADMEQQFDTTRGEVERLETELKRGAKRAATRPTPPGPVFDWETIYRDYYAMNQAYIRENQTLRLEHDALAEEHRQQALAWDAIDLQRVQTIEGLTLARNRLAALHRPRFVVVLGIGATYGEDSRIHYGLQLTAGVRLDDLFSKRGK